MHARRLWSGVASELGVRIIGLGLRSGLAEEFVASRGEVERLWVLAWTPDVAAAGLLFPYR